MSVKTYAYDSNKQLTEHFRVSEFRCKCGTKHKIKIDSDLCPVLEKVMIKLGASKGNIISGYRCRKHDKAVGGSGKETSSHVCGYAADIEFYDNENKKISSKKVALCLEDIGHKKGIGYRCGGNALRTHIDTKPRKWYGDEAYSMTKNCCKSFYEYFNEPKPQTKKYIQVIANSGVWCRIGIGFKYSKYKLIPNLTICELLLKNAGKSNGYNWDKVIYKGEVVYLPNKWNKII